MCKSGVRRGWLLCSLIAISAPAWAADIRISGSDTMEPYFETATAQHAKRQADARFTQTYKGTGAGLADLCEGKADIVPASTRMNSQQAAKCAGKGVQYLELPLAFDAVAVIVNRASPASELTMDELARIFHPESAGKVLRWSGVRAALGEVPLKVVSLDAKSGTTAFFTDQVTRMRGFVRSDAVVTAAHDKVIDLVAADPGAVGFVSLSALKDSRAAVRALPVNFGRGPVVPDSSTVLSDAYGPLSRLLYVYINRASLDRPEVRAFANHLAENASRYARFAQFVPLTDANYREVTDRVQTGKTGAWR